jgi:alanyl-tRNA synthetase
VTAVGLDADEPQIFVTVDAAGVKRGLSAGALVQGVVGRIQGKGGGRPEMAQGRGTRREGLPEALAAIESAVRARLQPPA